MAEIEPIPPAVELRLSAAAAQLAILLAKANATGFNRFAPPLLQDRLIGKPEGTAADDVLTREELAVLPDATAVVRSIFEAVQAGIATLSSVEETNG